MHPQKCPSPLCFPKCSLKECTSSKKECTPSSPSLPQKQEECLFPPHLQKKREKSANTPPLPPPPPLTEGSAPTPERRECTHPWKEGSLPAHHPTVAWFVRHCAWLHDRFVMKRQDEQTLFQTSSPFFENQDFMCSISRGSGCRHLGRTRQLGRYAHHFDKTRSFIRQINPQVRTE